MSDGFTKLFNSLITSSVWSEDDKTRIVWITLLALADEDGYVGSSLVGLAHSARVSVEDCEKALEKLMSPDKYSRSKECDGKRVALVDGGVVILNYSKYRDRARTESRKEYLRKYMREYMQGVRQGVKQDESNTCLTVKQKGLTNVKPSASASAYASVDKKKEEVQEEKTSKRFRRPTPLEVAEYAQSIRFNHLANHPEEFCDFYDAKGWVVGKTPMKDWQAAVRTWKQKHKAEGDYGRF